MKKFITLIFILLISLGAMAQEKTDGYKFITANIAYNNYSKLAYGLTFGNVNKTGWFASIMTNFNFKGLSTDMECDENFLVDGNYPYYTGKEIYTSLSVMAGFVYKISDPLALRIGAGYGNRTMAYEMTDGKLVKNTSVSATGLDLSVGAQMNIDGYLISLDCVTTSFKYFEAKIGFGLGFKK